MANFNPNNTQDSGFQAALTALRQDAPSLNQNNIDTFTKQLEQKGSQFNDLFTNFVGRAPTQDEAEHFYQNFIVPNITALHTPGSDINTQFGSNATQFINQTYQNAAKDYAAQQLQAQQGQANDLANLFRQQGNQSINDVQSQLLDYQSRLFDKLRPNLITSLASQGLLDTGGLNQAVAGAQADLANSITPFLAQQRLGNEQQANQIAFGGASAPYMYQQAAIQNQVPYLQQAGQSALDQNYNTYLNNLNFQHQQSLLNQQAALQQSAQPSFLRTLGQGFAGGLGTSLGQAGGSWFNANTYTDGGKSAAAATI